MRKKLEPSVASWVEEGREIATNTKTSSTSENDEKEFAEWVHDFIDRRVQKYALEEAGDNYTAEERAMGIENVNTGLKRKFDEEDSDGEDEDEEMEDVSAAVASVGRTATGQVGFGMGEIKDPNGKARSVEQIWMFATTGMLVEPNFARR